MLNFEDNWIATVNRNEGLNGRGRNKLRTYRQAFLKPVIIGFEPNFADIDWLEKIGPKISKKFETKQFSSADLPW